MTRDEILSIARGTAELTKDSRDELCRLALIGLEHDGKRVATVVDGSPPAPFRVDEAPEPFGIRICPRRDGPCPHGMSCTYWQHDMDCSTEPRRPNPALQPGE